MKPVEVKLGKPQPSKRDEIEVQNFWMKMIALAIFTNALILLGFYCQLFL